MTDEFKTNVAVALIAIMLLVGSAYLVMGNSGVARFKKNWRSKWDDGINREIIIYNAGGEVVFELEGTFDFKYDEECIEYIDTQTGLKHNIFAGDNSTVIINEIGE